MFTVERIDTEDVDWKWLDNSSDRNVYQTKAWLSFIAAAQQAEVVVAEVRDGDAAVGYFTGLVVRRYGLRVRCAHVEIRDRLLAAADYDDLGLAWTPARTHLIDLRRDEDDLFGNMDKACRRSIRKATSGGIVVEVTAEPGFADDFYDQLRDVFAKQRLVPTYPAARVRALIEHVGPTGNLLLQEQVRHRGNVCAMGPPLAVGVGGRPAPRRQGGFRGAAQGCGAPGRASWRASITTLSGYHHALWSNRYHTSTTSSTSLSGMVAVLALR